MTDERGGATSGPVDYGALFTGLPTAYLVMDRDLVIVEANDAYLALVGRARADLVGRPVFEAFPPTPDALDERGRNPVQVSFERARDTRLPDAMPMHQYDVVDPVTGEVVERFWSLISAPLLDERGETVLVLQRVEDITDYVHERRSAQAEAEHAGGWRERVEAVEADLYLRLQQLRTMQQARDEAALRLASLGEVALQLATAESVEDLERIVVGRGMAVLGADGGAVVSRADDGGWRVTSSPSLGEQVRERYGSLPYDSPLPACWTARTGRPLLLPTAAEGVAFDPAMATVHHDTGHRAWVMLPLLVRDECLGSLAVSWVEDRSVQPDELDLLVSLAAQCALALDRLLALAAERRAASAVARMSETMQRALLTDPPQPDGLQIVVRYSPAAQDAQVGGDWYDAFVARDGVTSLVVGDVTGHDRDAAAAMSQLRNLLRGIAYAVARSPAGVLTTLDQAVHDLQEDTLATLVLAQLEPVEPVEPVETLAPDRDGAPLRRHRLRWSSCGHLPPLLIHPDGTVELLDEPSDLMLGVTPDAVRHNHITTLESGSTLLLYTDGLVERRDEAIDVSIAQLARTVQELEPMPLEDLCDAVLRSLPGVIEDDVALLAVRTGVSTGPGDGVRDAGGARRTGGADEPVMVAAGGGRRAGD